jgi:hypothetical protein
VRTIASCLTWVACGTAGSRSERERPDPGTPSGCSDRDSDGSGIGGDCERRDCDDTDPFVQSESDCAARCEALDGLAPTCACTERGPRTCYSGPADTLDVGTCRGGEMECVNGRWGPCEGQVLPLSAEAWCDGSDEDCDGVADDGVEHFACGDCYLTCEPHVLGVGGEPWDVEAEGTEITEDEMGAIALDGSDAGTYAHAWVGCDFGGGWIRLIRVRFEMETPIGSAVHVAVRTAGSASDLPGSEWVDLGVAPGLLSPAWISELGDGTTHAIETRLDLVRTPGSASPSVSWISVDWDGICGHGDL